MEWWQIASAVVGFVGGAAGIATVFFRLSENHRPPEVTLEKIPGSGWDIYIVEVTNPCLVPSTVLQAGLAFGSMRDGELVFDETKCPFKMTAPGEASDGKPYLVRERDRSFVLPPRGVVRAGVQRSLLASVASECRAVPRDGWYTMRGYCVAAHPGLWRHKLRLSKQVAQVADKDARPA
jgi:hypothetical protein